MRKIGQARGIAEIYKENLEMQPFTHTPVKRQDERPT
jgi:hypothetical protein